MPTICMLRCLGDLAEAEDDAAGQPPSPASSPLPLPIAPGSFLRVAKGLPADQALTALTVECWVRPRKLNTWQSLIGQHNYPTACGYSLGIDVQGRIGFYVGDGGAYRPDQAVYGPALAQDQWQHVVGTWDGKFKSLWLNGRRVAEQAYAGPVRPGTAPLWLGACGHNLTGIPPRDRLPAPDYAIPKAAPFSSAAQWGVNVYYTPGTARRAWLAEQQGRPQIALGPGSAHPGTTGEVRLEFERFLLAGDPHACGMIWDLAVDERKGELYVLSDPRPFREAPELRVFDRQGRYVRTVRPFHPALPRANVQDLCVRTAREGDTELVIPKLFETLCGSLSLYGAFWHLPQKISLAPDGVLGKAATSPC